MKTFMLYLVLGVLTFTLTVPHAMANNTPKKPKKTAAKHAVMKKAKSADRYALLNE